MTTVTLPTYNPGDLARALRAQGLPGQRSKTAITALRRQRARNRPTLIAPRSVAERLNTRLVALYSAEITRRGGETSITDQHREHRLAVTDRHNGLTVLHVSAWRHYSRRHGAHPATLSYLCGREDGQLWAVRVPGTITTVRAASHWITPKVVREAERAGRRVQRQGDVYAVQTHRRYDGTGELPDRHTWDATRRVLSHPQHGELHLPDPVRFVPQNAYSMGRGAGRGFAD